LSQEVAGPLGLVLALIPLVWANANETIDRKNKQTNRYFFIINFIGMNIKTIFRLINLSINFYFQKYVENVKKVSVAGAINKTLNQNIFWKFSKTTYLSLLHRIK
jgi:hypothetical protein